MLCIKALQGFHQKDQPFDAEVISHLDRRVPDARGQEVAVFPQQQERITDLQAVASAVAAKLKKYLLPSSDKVEYFETATFALLVRVFHPSNRRMTIRGIGSQQRSVSWSDFRRVVRLTEFRDMQPEFDRYMAVPVQLAEYDDLVEWWLG